MIARIPWLQYALNFSLNRILVRWSCSQIYELFHPVKGTILSLHTVTSSCILISRHDHVLRSSTRTGRNTHDADNVWSLPPVRRCRCRSSSPDRIVDVWRTGGPVSSHPLRTRRWCRQARWGLPQSWYTRYNSVHVGYKSTGCLCRCVSEMCIVVSNKHRFAPCMS